MIFLILLLINVLYKMLKKYKGIPQKINAVLFSFFYFFEYFFIFIFNNYSFYLFLLYRYIKKRIETIYVINKYETKYKKKKEYKKNNFNYFIYIYNRRRLYFGFFIVYTQIFLRKIKEFKNYIIFYYIYKLKINYNRLKRNIINYSFFIYLRLNYNLIFFLEKKKKYINKIYIFFSFLLNYIKIQFNNNIRLIILKLLRKK